MGLTRRVKLIGRYRGLKSRESPYRPYYTPKIYVSQEILKIFDYGSGLAVLGVSA